MPKKDEKELTPLELKIICLQIGVRRTAEEIAELLGIERSSVYRTLKRTAVRGKITEILSDPLKILAAGMQGAAEKIVELSQGTDNPTVALKASQEILKSINPDTIDDKGISKKDIEQKLKEIGIIPKC